MTTTPNIKLGVVIDNDRFKGTYQVTAYGRTFDKRTTYGLFHTAFDAAVGAHIDAKIAIRQGIFMPTAEDNQRANFLRERAKRLKAERRLQRMLLISTERTRREVRKQLLRIVASI